VTESTRFFFHRLRGICKKDSRNAVHKCSFLHEYDLRKMPVCQFWRDEGECTNTDCIFRHVRQAESTIECPWYKRGFCRHGSKCKHKHLKRKACTNYLMVHQPRSCPTSSHSLPYPLHLFRVSASMVQSASLVTPRICTSQICLKLLMWNLNRILKDG